MPTDPLSDLFDADSPRSRVKRQDYDEIIERHSRENNLDPNLLRAIMGQESGGKPSAVSHKGARGLMQLMPGTAARFGTRNIHDPEENIRGGARYLKFLNNRFKGDVDLVLAGYNAGEGAVEKFGNRIPPYRETQNYVPAVKARYQKLTGQGVPQRQPSPDPLADLFDVGRDSGASASTTTPLSPQPAAEAVAGTEGAGQFPAGLTKGVATGRPELIGQRRQFPRGITKGAASGRPDLVAPPSFPAGVTTGTARGRRRGLVGPQGQPPDAAQVARQVGGAVIDQSLGQRSQVRDEIRRGLVASNQQIGINQTPEQLETEVNRLAERQGARQSEQAAMEAQRPEIDRIKAKLRDFAQPGARQQTAEGVFGISAEAGAQAGNLIQLLTGGQRGRGLTQQMRLSQVALAELEAEDPDKGWGAMARRVLPQAAGEFGKMYMLGRAGAGKAAMPVLGALSGADEGKAIEGAITGALYQKGFDKIAPLSRPAKAAIGVAGPTAVSVAQGEDLSKALLSNLAFAPMAIGDKAPPKRGVRGETKRTEQPVAEANTEPIAPTRRPIGETRQVEAVAELPRQTDSPLSVAAAPRWQHRDFGEVVQAESQAGVGRGKVRVVAEDGTEHVIQKPKGNGIGNNIAIPIREQGGNQPETTVPPLQKPAEIPPIVEGVTPREAPSRPAVIPVEVAPKPVSRNFRAGRNEATLTFASEAQRDLYDAGARLRKGEGQTRGVDFTPTKDPQIDALASRLGIDRQEAIRRAMDTHKDVRDQMKGVKDGEVRVVKDNIAPAAVESPAPEAKAAAAPVLPKSGWPDVKQGDTVYVEGKPAKVTGVGNHGEVLTAEGNVTGRYSKTAPELKATSPAKAFDVHYTTPEGKKGKMLGVEANTAAEAITIAKTESPELNFTSAKDMTRKYGVPQPSAPEPEPVRSIRLGSRTDYDRIYPPGSEKRAAYEAGAKRAMDEKMAGKKPSVTELPPKQPAAPKPPSLPKPAPPPPSTTARREPEIKTSKLASGVEAKAIEAKLTEGFRDLPEYETVKVADQAAKASELLKSDLNRAIDIAKGRTTPPADLLPESVFIAVENHALKTGNVELLRDLATASTLPSEATGMGQRIRMLAERNPNSAVSAIREIQLAREAKAERQYRNVKKARESIKTEIKTELKQAAPKVREWSSFIESLRC